MQLEQYLSQRLGQTGPRKLPYEPTHHYTIRDHLLGLNKRFGLRVTDEEYFDASGSSQFLFKADGTVPMYYQRVQYNIPVQIWLPARYPKQAPVVYVVPTSNMIVKPNHSFVNMNGEVHADYVRQWCFPSYNLEDLVSYLQIRFGEDPPLFTRPENWESPPQPRPPQPSPQPAAQPHTAAHPPASAFHASNPLNPRPQTQPPPPTSTWPVRPPAQAQPDRDVLSSNPIWGGAYAAAQAAAGAARPSTSDPQSHPIGHVSPAATPAPTQPAPEPAKPVDPLDVDGDFKRAVLPGLTQRLQQTLRDYHATGKSEYASAREQRKELLERAEKVERVMASARAEKSALESSVSRMGSKIVEMDAWLRAHEHKLKGIDDAVDPEKVIVAVDPLNTQALEVRAEDMAIEDTLDALDRALERGDVDADAYMKQVRKLSRKQFFARSLGSLVRQAQQAHMQPQPAAGFPAGSVPQLAGHHGNLWGPPAPGGAAGPAASSGLTTTGSGSIHSSNPLAAYRT